VSPAARRAAPERSVTTFWIVHREASRRTAMARLAGVDDRAVCGAPTDPVFEHVPPAEIVLLGPSGDFEAELEFVNRYRPRLFAARWILLPDAADLEDARRLFDRLDPEILRFPPDAVVLRARLRAAEDARRREPLSARGARDRLAERFARWFADVHAPELLRALDPRLVDVPVLVRGEPGTGRGLFVHYLHAYGGTAGGAFAHAVCTSATTAGDIEAALAAADRPEGALPTLAIWLEGVDRLGAAAKARLLAWLEHAPPEAVGAAERIRWIATADDPGPGPRRPDRLELALGGIDVRLPPLRERADRIAGFAEATAQAWCRAHALPERHFAAGALAALREYPWPGNLRELEAVVVQTLAAGPPDPVAAEALRLGGRPFVVTEPPGEEAGDAPIREVPAPRPVPAGVAPERRTAPRPPEPVPAAPFRSPAEEPPLPAPEPLPPSRPVAFEPPADAGPVAAEPRLAPDPVAPRSVRHLAAGLAHEVRNPLSTLRTFVDMLPDRYGDEEFRIRFSDLAAEGVERIEDAIALIGRLATLPPPARETVDTTALLENLLEGHRDAIRQRHLLVLRELESGHPFATGDAGQLELALDALLDKSLGLVPEGGEMYVASSHRDENGDRALRILVRFRGRGPKSSGPAPVEPGLSPAENALEYAFAEAVLQAQGATLAVDAADPEETILLVDLPAA